MPASAPRAVRRAGTSAVELACRVAQPPSWPVLRAVSTSRTSGPRHSPRTIRSGRIRRAVRTSSVMVTAPTPWTLRPRSWRWMTWGWSGRSSLASSMHTIRSVGGTRDSRAASRVVLPVPVAPVIRQEARARTSPASTGARSAATVPASTSSARVKARRRLVRRQMRVPSSLSGGRTAFRRVPSGRVASTTGLASSSLRPQAAAILTARARASASPMAAAPTSSRPRPRSIQVRPAPTSTSVTEASSSRGWRSGPAPRTSARTRRPRSAMPSAPAPARAPSSRATANPAPRARAPRTRSSSSPDGAWGPDGVGGLMPAPPSRPGAGRPPPPARS